MGAILWTVAGLLIAGAVMYIASLRTRRLLPRVELPPGERMPRTPLQSGAGWTLAMVGALTALSAGLVAYFGPEAWWDRDAVRLAFTFMLIAALVIYLLFTMRIRRLEARDDGSFDERDSIILGRSGSGVGGTMMVVLAVWMIALTETFQATRLVPSYFLYLIFWSCVMANVIAALAGILLAYRRG